MSIKKYLCAKRLGALFLLVTLLNVLAYSQNSQNIGQRANHDSTALNTKYAKAYLDTLQARINLLANKGLPYDSLAGARAHIYEAREHLKKGNKNHLKKSLDSLNTYVTRAEKFYNEKVAPLGPAIDAAVKAALDVRKEVTGYQAKKIDSVLAVADSLRKKDFLLRANEITQKLAEILPSIKEDEARAAELRKAVPGEWVRETRSKSMEHKDVDAVERRVFTFNSDGSVYLVEGTKGQSGPYLKEDWEFRSWGTYDFKGDTIIFKISRLQAVRQDFERIRIEDGMPVWWKESHPRYDSLITDGSQDRFIIYGDLKDDFRR
jgi:hypothetical protein